MQQIELSAGKDTESVYQLIGSLMQNNREFQVVITVPVSYTHLTLPTIA